MFLEIVDFYSFKGQSSFYSFYLTTAEKEKQQTIRW